MIPPDFIDELLARTDIVEIIEARVTLKKTGQNYSGLCPFHNEKTPSFSVSQDKQFYFCFGCQAGGSALKFLLEFDRMDFPSAVEYLAGRVGMEVPRGNARDPRKSEKQKSLYNILDQSSAFYREQLRSGESRSRAVDYLKGRDVSGEIAKEFALGYAPPGWDNLLGKLAVSNADRQLLIDAGMVTEKPETGKTYDRFRDRIVFPIRDLRGRTIAFGGRVLDDDAMPKYLNSPETAVFHKGRELYGLFEARKKVRKLERLVVVEGYMDVIALAQHDLGYSVATLGTATSTAHVERMFKIVQQIIFCFDGDEAGRNAAWKALVVTLPAMQDGRDARFLFIPDGEDPDSLVRREGRESFEARLNSSSGLTDFFFQTLEQGLDLDSLEGRAALSKQAAPLVRPVPKGVLKELIINELAAKTGLDRESLLAATELDKEPPQSSAVRQKHLRQSRLAERALTILLRQPEVANLLDEDDMTRLDGEVGWQLLLDVIRWVQQAGKPSPTLLLSHYQESPYFNFLLSLAEREPMLSPDSLAEEFLDTVRKMLKEEDYKKKQRVIDELSRKPITELSQVEREMLRSHRRP